MSGPDNAKKLLTRHIKDRYGRFILNDDLSLDLPVVSKAPGIAYAFRTDHFTKEFYPADSKDKPHVKCIKKNGQPHAFVWHTKASQLKQAVRWGIIKPQSITGQVIATLGKSRTTAYRHITKGMIGNSFPTKMALLDLYQERFEALQELESMVNKNHSVEDYQVALDNYIKKIETLSLSKLKSLCHVAGLDGRTIAQITNDLKDDIERARGFKQFVNKDVLQSINRARGRDSIMEFVKQQMIRGLYEYQGINQDNTFSLERDSAFSRGALNDLIEDSFKVIHDHQPDLRNAVTEKHHGQFSADGDEMISYQFSQETIGAQEQRDILASISFIEGWDTVDVKNAKVSNGTQSENLNIFSATRWQTQRNFVAYLKSTGYYLLNIFKGFFVPTQPWNGETWSSEEFHLNATELQKHASPNQPFWRIIFKALKSMAFVVWDLLKGRSDTTEDSSIGWLRDFADDWKATGKTPTFQESLTEINQSISRIRTIEEKRLKAELDEIPYSKDTVEGKTRGRLADIEYDLVGQDSNDIVNALANGLTQATSTFSHHLYAKDPFGGIVFSAAFLAGAGALLAPSATAAVLGTSYVNWFTPVAYQLGGTKIAAALSAGSTQAQVFGAGLDIVFHGPSSATANTLFEIGKNPAMIAAGAGAAYGIGYLLANGIGGITIPWLSHFLKEDLGPNPDSGYPFIGAKAAFIIYELLTTVKTMEHQDPERSVLFKQLNLKFGNLEKIDLELIKKYAIALWLAENAKDIPKLSAHQLYILSAHIDDNFSEEQAASLKKILYPETPKSLAYQMFAIPLGYIPALLRVIISPFMSLIALIRKRENPASPMVRALSDLWIKIKKDLSRLLTAVETIIALAFNIVGILIKTVVYALTLIIGRLAALFELKPAHKMHKGFAQIHVLARDIFETLAPVRAYKDVTVANPTHTIGEIERAFHIREDRIIAQETDWYFDIDDEEELAQASMVAAQSEMSADHPGESVQVSSISTNPANENHPVVHNGFQLLDALHRPTPKPSAHKSEDNNEEDRDTSSQRPIS